MIKGNRYHITALKVAMTVIIAVALASCTSRRLKGDKKDLIPPHVMVTLLTDIYLADGLLNVPEVLMQHQMKDTSAIYMEILQKYGYTKPNLDKSLNYYFINKPKRLQHIYDQVLARLTEIESEVKAEAEQIVEINQNLWPGLLSYSLPETGTTDPVYFEYEVADTGTYTLTLSVIVFPDDQSDNPRITLWYWKADTSANGVSVNWEEKQLLKDGMMNYYTLSSRVPDSTFTHLRGWLMNHDQKPGRWEKHARIENISLRRFDPSTELP
jgi:hypothetical protein